MGFVGEVQVQGSQNRCSTKFPIMTVALLCVFLWLCTVVHSDGAAGEETSCKSAPGGGGMAVGRKGRAGYGDARHKQDALCTPLF